MLDLYHARVSAVRNNLPVPLHNINEVDILSRSWCTNLRCLVRNDVGKRVVEDLGEASSAPARADFILACRGVASKLESA